MANLAITNSTNVIAANTQQAMAATFKSLISVFGSSLSLSPIQPATPYPKRFKTYDLLVGTNGTPANNAMEFDLARVSALSSAMTVTPLSSFAFFGVDGSDGLSPGEGYALNYVAANLSVETGVTTLAQPWYFGLNQQASYRWVANPGGEIVTPAVFQAQTTFPGNGQNLRARSTTGYTGTATGTLHTQEM